MSGREELLACPFCGSPAELERQGHVACTSRKRCRGAGAFSNHGTPAEQNAEAIALWNTRPQPADGGDGEDAAMFKWLATCPNLYVVADLLKAGQYLTLRRACESLMPPGDAAIAAQAGDGGK